MANFTQAQLDQLKGVIDAGNKTLRGELKMDLEVSLLAQMDERLKAHSEKQATELAEALSGIRSTVDTLQRDVVALKENRSSSMPAIGSRWPTSGAKRRATGGDPSSSSFGGGNDMGVAADATRCWIKGFPECMLAEELSKHSKEFLQKLCPEAVFNTVKINARDTRRSVPVNFGTAEEAKNAVIQARAVSFGAAIGGRTYQLSIKPDKTPGRMATDRIRGHLWNSVEKKIKDAGLWVDDFKLATQPNGLLYLRMAGQAVPLFLVKLHEDDQSFRHDVEPYLEKLETLGISNDDAREMMAQAKAAASKN